MRIFKPESGVEIAESAATTGKAIDEVKKIIANLGYPQILNSAVQESKSGENTVITFLPAAGKKG